MIELLMLLIAPSEINPQKLGMKYVLKQKFVDYQTCEEYVTKNTYSKPGEQEMEGVFIKLINKNIKYFLLIVSQQIKHEMDYKMFKLYLEFCNFDTWNKDEKVREAYAYYIKTGEIKYDNGRKIRKSSKVSE